MDILQICPGAYQAGRGGISEHVKNVAERLARRHDVTVYATNPHRSLPWHETVNRVSVERFRRFAPSGSYFFSAGMLTRFRTARFDVVHSHGYHAFPMHFSTLTNCKKLVVSTHFHGAGHSVFRDCLFRLSKPIGRITLSRTDRIVAVSEFEKRLLYDFFVLDLNKVVVIPNGLDLSEFAGLQRRQQGFKSILYVGRLYSYKGAQYLVEVLPRLEDGVVLEIVGKGPLKAALQVRAKELGVYDRVLFFEDLPRNELLQKYKDADVFVLLSEHEAYSLAVAEALVAGTPCIVANTSALSEWVDNESCFGVEVPVRLDKLAKQIEKVLDRRVKREVVQSWIGTKILDWNDVVSRLETVYARREFDRDST